MNRIAALTLLFLPVFALAQNGTAVGAESPITKPAPSKYKRLDYNFIGTQVEYPDGIGLGHGGSGVLNSGKFFFDFGFMEEVGVGLIPVHGMLLIRKSDSQDQYDRRAVYGSCYAHKTVIECHLPYLNHTLELLIAKDYETAKVKMIEKQYDYRKGTAKLIK